MFFVCFVRVCVLLMEMKRRPLLEDGIKSSPLASVPVMSLALLEGVWRCVSDGSRDIRSVVVFGGSDWIRFLFVFGCVSTN